MIDSRWPQTALIAALSAILAVGCGRAVARNPVQPPSPATPDAWNAVEQTRPGTELRVELLTGTTIRGEYRGSDRLSIDIAGRSISKQEISRVVERRRRNDGIGDGSAIGLVAGAVAGAVLGGVCFAVIHMPECFGYVALGAGTGVASGAVGDAIHRGTETIVLYQAP